MSLCPTSQRDKVTAASWAAAHHQVLERRPLTFPSGRRPMTHQGRQSAQVSGKLHLYLVQYATAAVSYALLCFYSIKNTVLFPKGKFSNAARSTYINIHLLWSEFISYDLFLVLPFLLRPKKLILFFLLYKAMIKSPLTSLCVSVQRAHETTSPQHGYTVSSHIYIPRIVHKWLLPKQTWNRLQPTPSEREQQEADSDNGQSQFHQ